MIQHSGRPAQTTYVRYHSTRPLSVSLPNASRLEMVAVYLLICAFWGIVLFEALNAAL
jgi:hypothetical protein